MFLRHKTLPCIILLCKITNKHRKKKVITLLSLLPAS